MEVLVPEMDRIAHDGHEQTVDPKGFVGAVIFGAIGLIGSFFLCCGASARDAEGKFF